MKINSVMKSLDEWTLAHCVRVSQISSDIAKYLECDNYKYIESATYLHDIGKSEIPSYILNKPGKLTEEEFEIMKKHCEIGAHMLAIPEFKNVALYHHEKWNGTGYFGLAGVNIPIEARIVAVADVYDALVSSRPYKLGWTKQSAIAFIQNGSGTLFDPMIVDALIHIC